jgi:ketosteroid isomerase-like protein
LEINRVLTVHLLPTGANTSNPRALGGCNAYAVAERKDLEGWINLFTPDGVNCIYVDGNVVVVQLALQGTHDGPLQLPFGELPATGEQMDAPCCDVFELEDGKIKRFDCYPEGSIIFAQLGVLNKLDAALRH